MAAITVNMAALTDEPNAPELPVLDGAGAAPEPLPAAGKIWPSVGRGPGCTEADAPTPTRPFWLCCFLMGQKKILRRVWCK